MADTCSCCGGVEIGKPAAAPARVDANRTVNELIAASPAALAVMQRSGIDHCCGAALTLTEAAASAGADLPALLAALAEA
ncbi:MAG TPA: DUF542 domain-containing protein [Methylomirabilota bacterium]|nr:DUF542 domain-containing protein [Methylomirabilota bacterium]